MTEITSRPHRLIDVLPLLPSSGLLSTSSWTPTFKTITPMEFRPFTHLTTQLTRRQNLFGSKWLYQRRSPLLRQRLTPLSKMASLVPTRLTHQ